ncbi:MAG: WbuC family cupin fold metalloprotein [Tannerellaceae bacterium]|jgi:cupin fold WbuC family metalloprotein|nr:WbuC family cupin fold metalloprotein [Tannerellaceae bacterium]
MKIIDENLLNETTEKAKRSPRLRMNHNFHECLDEPVNRLINAMEPGTYLRPHRHINPDRDEAFLILRGKTAVFIFNELGNIEEQLLLDPQSGVYGAEIKAGVWHGLIVLETGTVLYEIKNGPYVPVSPANFAPWSPEPEDTGAVQEYLAFLTRQIAEACR